MTLQELSQYYKLRERIGQDREILLSLRAKARPGAQNLDGMPHAPGVSDKVGWLAIEIADMEDKIRVLEAEAKAEAEKLKEYIATIPDDRVRIICRFRFLYCFQWKEVADVLGKYYTEYSVRNLLYRYLEKEEGGEYPY